ncbi:MAG: hypothetical protein H8E85_06885 [Candidatus Marinimicrobia bacterium]|nr:hypothetical protein [Candidatus Neomarinimicrobiota bacterium]
MKPAKMFQEFEQLAESLEVKIIQEKGNFKGGYCLLEKEKVIVINKLKPLEQRIRALAEAFSRLDISNIYMKPAIRDIIASEVKNS